MVKRFLFVRQVFFIFLFEKGENAESGSNVKIASERLLDK